MRIERCYEQLSNGDTGASHDEMKLHEKCGDSAAHLGVYGKALTHYKHMVGRAGTIYKIKMFSRALI